MFREKELSELHKQVQDAAQGLNYVLKNRTPEPTQESVALYLHDIDMCMKKLELLREDIKLLKEEIQMYNTKEKIEGPLRRLCSSFLEVVNR